MCQSVQVPQAACRFRRMESGGFDLTALPSCYASAARDSYPPQLWQTCRVWSFCAFNQGIYIGRHCLTRSVHHSSNPGANSGSWTRCPRAPAMASSILNLGVSSPFSSRTRVTRTMSAERTSASWVSPADYLKRGSAPPASVSPGWLSPRWSAGRIGRSSGGRSPKESRPDRRGP